VGAVQVVDHGRLKLEIVRAEGVKRLSEMTAVCTVQLIQLGASMVENTGEAHWPQGVEARARIVRVSAQRMLAALQSLAQLYIAALDDAVRTSSKRKQCPLTRIVFTHKHTHTLAHINQPLWEGGRALLLGNLS
jgi:hypothetical protein